MRIHADPEHWESYAIFPLQRTDQASEGCGGGADGDGGEQVRPSHQEYRHATGQGRSQVSGIAQDFRYFEDSSSL